MTLLFTLAALLVVAVPTGLLMLRARARVRARTHLRESGGQILYAGETDIRYADGTPFAALHFVHPGADFPPSSGRVMVTSPTNTLLYTVDFGLGHPRRRETVVHGPDGRPFAIVRRQLMRQTHAEIISPTEQAPPLATIQPVAHTADMEWAVMTPTGEQIGTVLDNSDAIAQATELGMHPGLPEPLHAGLIGFALTRQRLFPSTQLERADDEWLNIRSTG